MIKGPYKLKNGAKSEVHNGIDVMLIIQNSCGAISELTFSTVTVHK